MRPYYTTGEFHIGRQLVRPPGFENATRQQANVQLLSLSGHMLVWWPFKREVWAHVVGLDSVSWESVRNTPLTKQPKYLPARLHVLLEYPSSKKKGKQKWEEIDVKFRWKGMIALLLGKLLWQDWQCVHLWRQNIYRSPGLFDGWEVTKQSALQTRARQLKSLDELLKTDQEASEQKWRIAVRG